MANLKPCMEAVAAGAMVTFVTGLYNSTPLQLIGAVWYGFPMTWIRYLMVGPQYNPWAVDYVGFAADLVVWSAVVGIVILVAKRCKEKETAKTAKRTRKRR
jgi:hypothetical protein